MSNSDARLELIHRDMEALEEQMKGQLELRRSQDVAIRHKKDDLGGDSDSDDEDNVERVAVAAEIQKQSEILEEVQVSLGVMFAQVRAARTHQVIGNVLTDRKSMALVGMPERLVGKMDQRIGNVTTTDESSALVGVFGEETNLKNFFKRPERNSG